MTTPLRWGTCSRPPDDARRLSSAVRALAACCWLVGCCSSVVGPVEGAAAALRALTLSSFERTRSTSITEGGGPETLQSHTCCSAYRGGSSNASGGSTHRCTRLRDRLQLCSV